MRNYSYLKSENAEYIDELYARYLEDPESVDDSWRYFFEGLELGEEGVPGTEPHVVGVGVSPTPGAAEGKWEPTQADRRQTFSLSAEAKVAELINAYRERGRVLAKLDPLSEPPAADPLLDPAHFGLTEADLDREFTAGQLIGIGKAKLRDIIAHLRSTYSGTIGVEFTHIEDSVSREWLRQKMEGSRNREEFPAEVKKTILRRLTEAEAFERFIHTRYVGQKRFSVEGGESLLPALDAMVEIGAELGAEQFVMGMAHRGRLNVLHNTFGKPAEYIFTEFEQAYQDEGDTTHEGDVKYHMGYSSDVTTAKGKSVHLSLAHNPSHLEFVNPVVNGIARGKQRYLRDLERSKVVSVQIHGDAAFAGQGIVYETLNLSQLTGYFTGGTFHIVINNQVGFTTDPGDARSTTYATDLAKMLETPIFHVNGDDPEAVVYVSKLCMEFRQRFKRDVFIDLICYRRYGHNEGDEPAFTQPTLYDKIRNHTTTRELYSQRLVSEGVITTDEARAMLDEVNARLSEAQKKTRTEKPKPFVSAFQSIWQKFHRPSESELFMPVETKVDEKTLRELSAKLNSAPSGFNVHPKLVRMFESRQAAIDSGTGLDWGNAEALAFASLLIEGHPVRLSGQDAERGTFSHRHSVLHDHKSGEEYCPFNHLGGEEFIVQNSSLSESGVMGFEYGWSLADPNALVMWEAQFGDFANGAQVIIDQFIASGEPKWHRASGIVLLLPHGYEGQGPEHSSARLERFLQLCGKQNMAVCNFSTPAQIFHGLRRQLKRDFRKPLVVMTPKSLLRHPKAVSDLSELSQGHFQEVIDDPMFASGGADRKKVRRLLLCSGKVFYDLAAAREEAKRDDVAIIRVEQLYPWPARNLATIIGEYSADAEIFWTQEEPQNMGAWLHVFSIWMGGTTDRFGESVGGRPIRYIGRGRMAAPAVGSHKVHVREQQAIVDQAFSL